MARRKGKTNAKPAHNGGADGSVGTTASAGGVEDTGSARTPDSQPAAPEPNQAGAQAAGKGEGGAGGQQQAPAEGQGVTAAPVLDPDGNPPNDEGLPAGAGPVEAGDKAEGNVLAARLAATAGLATSVAALPREAAIVLASFFRIFPDSPDEAGPTELKRFKIELPEEDRPGLLLAMVRVFRCVLDQLDRLDREDAARAKAAEPKPKPEQWREPRGYKLTKEAMKPGSGLKPRR